MQCNLRQRNLIWINLGVEGIRTEENRTKLGQLIKPFQECLETRQVWKARTGWAFTTSQHSRPELKPSQVSETLDFLHFFKTNEKTDQKKNMKKWFLVFKSPNGNFPHFFLPSALCVFNFQTQNTEQFTGEKRENLQSQWTSTVHRRALTPSLFAGTLTGKLATHPNTLHKASTCVKSRHFLTTTFCLQHRHRRFPQRLSRSQRTRTLKFSSESDPSQSNRPIRLRAWELRACGLRTQRKRTTLQQEGLKPRRRRAPVRAYWWTIHSQWRYQLLWNCRNRSESNRRLMEVSLMYFLPVLLR